MQPPEDFTTDSHSVDFLVVTALKDEYTALVSSLPELTVKDRTLFHQFTKGRRVVPYRDSFYGQTTVVAAVEVKDAISRRNRERFSSPESRGFS